MLRSLAMCEATRRGAANWMRISFVIAAMLTAGVAVADEVSPAEVTSPTEPAAATRADDVPLEATSPTQVTSSPQPDYARSGWYLALGGFYAISDYSLNTNQLGTVPPEPANTNPKFGNSGGVDVRGGYRLSPHWAIEADYQWQAGFDSTNGAIAPLLEIDTHLLSLNTKLFAMTGRWQPYALVGASLLIVNTEIVNSAFKKPWDLDVGFAPRFGAGMDYYLNENWALTLEGTYIVPVGAVSGANMGSVGAGIQYRF